LSNTIDTPDAPQQVIYVERAPEPKNGLAIVALILGVIGLVLGLVSLTGWLAIMAGFTATLLGLVAWRRKRKGRATAGKTAIMGTVAGLMAMVMGVIGMITLFTAVDDAVNGIDTSVSQETKNDTPAPVKEGAAFTHDGYKVAAGWKVASEQYGGLTIKHLKVTNVSHATDTGDTPMFTFSLWKGSENLAQIDASGNQLAKGETTKMDAYSDSSRTKVPAFDTIKVKDAF